MRWTSDQIETLKTEYPLGDKKSLAEKLGVSYSTLKGAAKRYGVKSTKDQNLYKLEYLMGDSLDVFYWLGFILADGSISNRGNLRIRLSVVDKAHLEKLGSVLGIKVTEYTYNTNFKEGRGCSLTCLDSINGPKILERLRVQSNKTKNPPTNLDFLTTDCQFISFLLGFIDGDGTVRKRYGIQVNCHAVMLPVFILFQERLAGLGIKSYSKLDSRGYSLFTICTSADVLFLKNFAKNYQIPILERKWDQI